MSPLEYLGQLTLSDCKDVHDKCLFLLASCRGVFVAIALGITATITPRIFPRTRRFRVEGLGGERKSAPKESVIETG